MNNICNKTGYTKTPRCVTESLIFKNQKTSVKYLYRILCDLFIRFQYDWFFHSINQLKIESGLSSSTIINNLKILNNLNYIQIKQQIRENGNSYQSNKFYINYINEVI